MYVIRIRLQPSFPNFYPIPLLTLIFLCSSMHIDKDRNYLRLMDLNIPVKLHALLYHLKFQITQVHDVKLPVYYFANNQY